MSQWIVERVPAQRVSGDEKGLTIRGRWHDWVVVLEVTTARPGLAAWLPARSPGACGGIGQPLRRLTTAPRLIITDGLQAYADLQQGASHVLGRLHHQQGVTHWFKPHLAPEEESSVRQRVMTQVVPTHDTRTVRRRLARLRERAPGVGLTPWGTGVEEKVPPLSWSVGSRRLPSTTQAIARFCRAVPRFYRTRGGFHSVPSATRELVLCFVVSLFTQHATTGQAPLEGIVPEARRLPLSRLSNDPCRALQERGNVTRTPQMADVLRSPQAAA